MEAKHFRIILLSAWVIVSLVFYIMVYIKWQEGAPEVGLVLSIVILTVLIHFMILSLRFMRSFLSTVVIFIAIFMAFISVARLHSLIAGPLTFVAIMVIFFLMVYLSRKMRRKKDYKKS
jgi:hypothetical protein